MISQPRAAAASARVEHPAGLVDAHLALLAQLRQRALAVLVLAHVGGVGEEDCGHRWLWFNPDGGREASTLLHPRFRGDATQISIGAEEEHR